MGRIVIVGAGPAGMMLAHQLVTHGATVHVLERNADFDREFRGELIGPSVLPALEKLDLLPTLVERGLARKDVERRMIVGATRRVTLPSGTEHGALVSQPGLLALLHERCSKHDHYRLDFKSSVTKIERGRVEVKGAEPIEADVVVVCSGRNTKLRSDMPLDLDEKPDDTLWLRFDFSDKKDALPKDVDVHMFGGGVVVVLFATSKSRLQIAFSSPGDASKLRNDRDLLKASLLPRLNEPLRSIVARKLEGEFESQILRVAIDRLTKWSVPGVLFLGDAAHTMGPAGAQGLNLAIRDAIVASNHILDAIDSKRAIDESVFAAIEAERRPEIEASQATQLRAYRMVGKPIFVQHLMFTMLSIVMRFKKFGAPALPPVEPRP